MSDGLTDNELKIGVGGAGLGGIGGQVRRGETRVGNRERKGENKRTTGEIKEKLKVYFINSRSLGNKINELRTIASNERPDIIGICETWLDMENKHLKSEFFLDGYKLFNTDRCNNKKGGGVILYVRDNLQSYTKADIKSSSISETVWVELGFQRNKILVGVIYRPPNLDQDNSEIIYNEISKASRSNTVCIMGDFNFRGINWNSISGDRESSKFLEIVEDNFLYQKVLEPTRENNVLDLVLTNKSGVIENIEVGEPLANSDHNSIRFDIIINGKIKENKSVVPNFRAANFEGLRANLAIQNWQIEEVRGEVIDEVQGTDLISVPREFLGAENEGSSQVLEPGESVVVEFDYVYENFISTLKDIQGEFIPTKIRKSENNDPNWMNNSLKHLIGKKKGIYRKLRRGEEHLRQSFLEEN